MRSTLQYLLNTFLPNDKTNGESMEEPRRAKYPHKISTQDEVKAAIWKISTRKSPGEDGISAPILRKSWHILEDKITTLFEDLITYGYFPRIWRTADV